MNTRLGRVHRLLQAQGGLIAAWQMRQCELSGEQIKVTTRGLRSVHRGVYAEGDLDELGWLRAATLIAPGAVVSHGTALALLALRDEAPEQLHITLPSLNGSSQRDGIVSRSIRKEPPKAATFGTTREQFEEDRRRGMVHAAIRQASADRAPRSKPRRKQPK